MIDAHTIVEDWLLLAMLLNMECNFNLLNAVILVSNNFEAKHLISGAALVMLGP